MTAPPHNRQPHYTELDEQPIDLIARNGLLAAFCVGNIIKYVLRFDRKNGLEDLGKARQYLHWLTGWVTEGPGYVPTEHLLDD